MTRSRGYRHKMFRKPGNAFLLIGTPSSQEIAHPLMSATSCGARPLLLPFAGNARPHGSGWNAAFRDFATALGGLNPRQEGLGMAELSSDGSRGSKRYRDQHEIAPRHRRCANPGRLSILPQHDGDRLRRRLSEGVTGGLYGYGIKGQWKRSLYRGQYNPTNIAREYSCRDEYSPCTDEIPFALRQVFARTDKCSIVGTMGAGT